MRVSSCLVASLPASQHKLCGHPGEQLPALRLLPGAHPASCHTVAEWDRLHHTKYQWYTCKYYTFWFWHNIQSNYHGLVCFEAGLWHQNNTNAFVYLNRVYVTCKIPIKYCSRRVKREMRQLSMTFRPFNERSGWWCGAALWPRAQNFVCSECTFTVPFLIWKYPIYPNINHCDTLFTDERLHLAILLSFPFGVS